MLTCSVFFTSILSKKGELSPSVLKRQHVDRGVFRERGTHLSPAGVAGRLFR